MQTNITIGAHVDKEFIELVNSVPYELRKLQGIANLDSFEHAEQYFSTDSVAHMSIDPNANIGTKSPVSFQSEIFKPQLKYLSYYQLWKTLKALYSTEEANECIKNCLTGKLYFHDITKLNVPYCFAFDTSFLMTQGRPYGWLPSTPPKRSNSFMSQVIETTMDMSQNHAGA